MAESADGPNVPYTQGAHPTMAGNALDPNIGADAKLSSTGQGVGGTSEENIRQEGLEHIKRNIDNPTAESRSGIDSGVSSGPVVGAGSTGSYMNPQPPASNPGSDDATGGIAKDAGGVSGSAYKDAAGTVPGESTGTTSSGGILGTVSSYLGLGGKSETKEARNVDDVPQQTSASGLDTARDNTVNDAAVGGAATAAGGAATAGTVGETMGTDPARNTEANAPPPRDSDVTTGNAPTESADPTTADTAVKDTERKAEGEAESKPKAGGAAGGGVGLEHKEAIPTAGGERLGEKHWGESKVVPDNPKPKPEDAGVSSADGQPTSEVRDNTNKNTGSAVKPGSHEHQKDGEQKEGLVDKIKDKLHIGGHKK